MDSTFINRIYPTACYATGSCMAEIIANPIYTVKTRYQTSKTNESMKDVIKNDYRKYGLSGFYNSVFSAILARFVSSFLKFMIYSEIKYYRQTEDNDLYNNMLNGCTAGICSSFVVHPIDTMTNYLQRHQPITKDFFKRDIMYAGFSQTIIRNFFLYSVLFPVFDYTKTMTNNNIPLSCMITTAISSSILQYIELRRTRMMAQEFKTSVFWWKGFPISYIANATHFTLTMSIMYYLMQYKHFFI